MFRRLSVVLFLVGVGAQNIQNQTDHIPLWNVVSYGWHDFPIPPVCPEQHPTDLIVPASITLWFLDSPKYHPYGLIYWEEDISTECTESFFGVVDKIVKKSVISLPDRLDSTYASRLLEKMEAGETRDLTETEVYTCSWMKTDSKDSVRLWVKKDLINFNIDGTIPGPSLFWIPEGSLGHYVDSFYRLYLPPRVDSTCPPLIGQTFPGLVHHTDNITFVSIPSNSLQLSLNIHQDKWICTFNSLRVYKTASNHLISLNMTDYLSASPPKIPNSMGKISNDWDTPRMTYTWNHLIEMIEEDLYKLEREICRQRHLEWTRLIKDSDWGNLAEFMTGIFWAEYTDFDMVRNRLKLGLPRLSNFDCSLPSTREIKNHLLKLTCNGTEAWVEPLSNINRTMGFESQWKPFYLLMKDGSYLDYVTLKTVYPLKSQNFHLTRVSEIATPFGAIQNPRSHIELGAQHPLLKTKYVSSSLISEISSLLMDFRHWFSYLLWSVVIMMIFYVIIKTCQPCKLSSRKSISPMLP